MKRIVYCLFLLLSCCTAPEKKAVNASKTNDSIDLENAAADDTVAMIEKDRADSEQDDCVFNNDFNGLTREWLDKLGITSYVWDDRLKRAAVPRGQDTVYLSKGGCVHFNISVDVTFEDDQHMLSDTTYWLQQALKLAEEFDMDHYEKMIAAGKLTRAQHNDSKIWYEVADDDPDDNLIYTGIEISFEHPRKRIGIAQYFN